MTPALLQLLVNGDQGQNTPYGIPAEHWPTVVHRVVEQKEPLRTVAAVYGVSHETIRRMMHHVKQPSVENEA